jgi:hypothetical protein
MATHFIVFTYGIYLQRGDFDSSFSFPVFYFILYFIYIIYMISDTRCHFLTGVPGQPKMVNGAILSCSTDAECGNNFLCVRGGYCCRQRTGKYA